MVLRSRWFTEGTGSGTAGGEGEGKPTGTAGANTGSVEELNAQIADLTAKHNQALAEKSGYEETKKKLVEAQQMLAQVLQERSSQPPTAGGYSGPFADIDMELAQLDAILSKAPNDPVTLRAKRDALAERDAREWELRKQAAWQRIGALQDEALRQRSWEMFCSGVFATPDAAILAARGAVTAEAERKKADEEAKAKAESRPSTGTADAGASGAGGGNNKPMTGSEYVRFLRENEGSKKAHDLIAAMDAGQVTVDWAR